MRRVFWGRLCIGVRGESEWPRPGALSGSSCWSSTPRSGCSHWFTRPVPLLSTALSWLYFEQETGRVILASIMLLGPLHYGAWPAVECQQREVGTGRTASCPLLLPLPDILEWLCLKGLCARACLLASRSDSSLWPIT